MLAAASLGKVQGVSIREVYESDDPNYLLLVSAVIDRVITAREKVARDAERRSNSVHR